METVKRLRKYPKIEIVSHLINGLPGETHEMMVENVRRCVTNNDIQGIKLHLLHLMTNTRMQRDYHEGRLQLMSQDEYVRVICDQLEIIPKHIVIHRITGDAPRDMLIGLMWSLNKWEALNSIEMEMRRRSCWNFKGKSFQENHAPRSPSGYGDRDGLAYSDLYAQRFCLCDFRDGVGNDSRTYLDQSNL